MGSFACLKEPLSKSAVKQKMLPLSVRCSLLQNTTKRHALAFCYGTDENRGLYVGLYTQSYQIAKDETRSRLNEIKLQ